MARQDKTDLRVVVAANIKMKMSQLGIESYKQLSALANVSPSMVSTILGAKTSPRIDTIQRIAGALNCPASDLFHQDPDDVPAMRDEVFLQLYARYQLASSRDQELVKRILTGDF